jgi:hypothetical protein
MRKSYLPVWGAALVTAVSCAETSKIDDAGGGGTAGAFGGFPGGGIPTYSGGGPTAGGAPIGGTSGAPSSGGSGALGTGGGSPGDASACAPTGPMIDLSTFTECPTCVGKAAHCVPTTLVQATAPGQVSQLTPCTSPDAGAAATLCVPDVLIKTLGKYDPPDCASIGGGAGRCLSECIGAVANLGSFLPKATCADGEKCAPCSDPRTGADTGACSLQCDVGPTEPKVLFAKCCSDQSGLCVPPDIVDPTQAKALAQDSCSAGNLCAPAKFADPTFHPQVCTSVGGAEGRCLSKCVSLVAKNESLLPAGGCAANELCAPCTDPRTGELTGACSLNGDAPTKPPVLFDKECCGTTGLCVPKSAVPAEFATLVPVDNCAGDGGGADWVCAPKIKLNDINARFPECIVMLLGLEVPVGDPNHFGACIPKCIADAQISSNPLTGLGIAQSNCQPGWMCAPCVNPTAGNAPTGACECATNTQCKAPKPTCDVTHHTCGP